MAEAAEKSPRPFDYLEPRFVNGPSALTSVRAIMRRAEGKELGRAVSARSNVSATASPSRLKLLDDYQIERLGITDLGEVESVYGDSVQCHGPRHVRNSEGARERKVLSEAPWDLQMDLFRLG